MNGGNCKICIFGPNIRNAQSPSYNVNALASSKERMCLLRYQQASCVCLQTDQQYEVRRLNK